MLRYAPLLSTGVASESLKEGMDDLLTLHRIGMPPELRKSFYTSNPIDSAFSSTKLRTMMVKRWNKKTDMIKRWASTRVFNLWVKMEKSSF